jgi:hypothetical protein
MTQLRRTAALLGLASLLAAPVRAAPLPPVWQAWLNSLTQAGYTVTQGASQVITVSYCQQVIDPVFGTCFISDPTDPYVLSLVPVAPGDYIDPYFGAVGAQTLPNGTVVSSAFRLAPPEAELVIVNLPPTAAYFSYQGYMFTRPISAYPGGVQKLSPDPSRADIASTYNNSINDADIRAPATSGWPQGTVGFISTPNQPTAADMQARFATAGGNPATLFIDPLGPNTNPGPGAANDDFMTLLRTLEPEDPAATQAWLANAASNVLVFRIDPPATLPTQPYGTQPLWLKYANTDERSYAADIAELAGIMKTWLATQEKKRPIRIQTARVDQHVSATGKLISGNFGDYCIAHGLNCNDDEQDGLHWNAGIGIVRAGDLFVLEGVNQAADNNTTEMSLSVTDTDTNTGVLGVSQTNPAAAGFANGSITGSAQAALMYLNLWSKASPQLQAAAPNMWIQIFTRGCAPPQDYCTQPWVADISNAVEPLANSMYIDQRSYLLPGQLSSANDYYLLRYDAIY